MSILNAVSYTIFKYRRHDEDQDLRYPHLHGSPNAYWPPQRTNSMTQCLGGVNEEEPFADWTILLLEPLLYVNLARRPVWRHLVLDDVEQALYLEIDSTVLQ
ncbi:hypothetical protein TNCV_733231 [Trichonephila clavipes]|nr:hypothetical protein TNCV_733231 [Trichonephila clavipes]